MENFGLIFQMVVLQGGAEVAEQLWQATTHLCRCAGPPSEDSSSSIQVPSYSLAQHCMLHVLHNCRDRMIKYCEMPVPDYVLASFKDRKDGNIMGLELLSIALGEGRNLQCQLWRLCSAWQALPPLPQKFRTVTLSSGPTTWGPRKRPRRVSQTGLVPCALRVLLYARYV